MRYLSILIADSDPAIRRLLSSNLEARNYSTLEAFDGAEALEMINREMPDLIILDLMLPVIDGLEVCRHIRTWSQVPILLLSAVQDESKKINCLNAGADDILVKPLNIEEVIARVKAIFRRVGNLLCRTEQGIFASGDLEIKFTERKVKIANREINLTPIEYNLLQELALNADRVLTHSLLLNKIWGPEYGQEREYLRVFIGRLRKKLEVDPRRPNYIITIPWVGYKFNSSGEMRPN